MNRYLIFGSIFLFGIFITFLVLPSSPHVEKVEDIDYIIDKKESKSSHKESHSVNIEYESTPPLLTSNSSKSSTNLFLKEEPEIVLIEKLIGEKDLKPVYKEWKSAGGVFYNIYIKTPDSEESKQELIPPAIPLFKSVEISGKKVNIVIPNGAEGYIVTKDGNKIDYQPIERNDMESITPPPIN